MPAPPKPELVVYRSPYHDGLWVIEMARPDGTTRVLDGRLLPGDAELLVQAGAPRFRDGGPR